MMEENKKQFENMYREESDAIYRFCLYKTSNAEQSADLVQESFIRLWNTLVEGKKVDNMKAFLYQIARNLIIDFYRKKKSMSLDAINEEGFEPRSNDHEQIENKFEASIVIQLINKLDEKYRDVVYMKLVEDLDIKEIAKGLKITTNNATVRLHRGIKYLKDLYNNE